MQLWRDDEARESRSEVSQIVSFGAERANSHGLRADAECAESASQARYSKTVAGLMDCWIDGSDQGRAGRRRRAAMSSLENIRVTPDCAKMSRMECKRS